MDDMEKYLRDIASQVAGQGGLSGSGVYFKVGKYKATLKKGQRKTGHGGLSDIFEFRVDSALKTGAEEPNAPGSTVSVVLKPNATGDLGLMSKKKMMQIAAAFAGVSDSDFLTPEGQSNVAKMYAALIHPTNPCRGMAVGAEAYLGQNKKKETQTYVSFTHDPLAFSAEEVARRRTELDSEG